MNEPGLRAPTFDEAVAVDNYKSASKEALSAANSVADKIVTTAFSIATVYGAVIALVAPKETPAPVVAALPFLFLAAAVGLALHAQSIGIGLSGDAGIARLAEAVTSTVHEKRRWGRWALLSLASGVLAAGVLVHEMYGEPAQPTSPISVAVWLTPSGVQAFEKTCDSGKRSLVKGQIDDVEELSKRWVPIEVTARVCPAGEGTLILPRRHLVVAKE